MAYRFSADYDRETTLSTIDFMGTVVSLSSIFLICTDLIYKAQFIQLYYGLDCYRLGTLQKGDFTETRFKDIYTRISKLTEALANDHTHPDRRDRFLEWRKEVAANGM